MKQTYGNLRRTFFTTLPVVYDRTTRMAYIDIQPDTQLPMANTESENEDPVKGFSGFAVQTDGVIDYGHLKSLLIEAAYPQKDEHAIAINTIAALLHKVEGKELTEAEKADLVTFDELEEYRALCAECARNVVNMFKV
jgi:Ca2+-binding EF-hand superfamily protein